MKIDTRALALCMLACAFLGAFFAIAAMGAVPKSQNELIKEFYAAETASSVSPADYIDSLRKGNQSATLVDLRTKGEYEKGHLVTAVNIPAGTMSGQQLAAAFRKLPAGRPIVNYCYYEYCMLSRQVGRALSDSGIYALHMTAGWYEINRDYPAYVVNGSAPGQLDRSQYYPANACSPAAGGEYGC